eukprot:4406783-Alexandrium_andersonii.AAC.1
MSASLVGSEMCIRDRRQQRPQQKQLNQQRPQQQHHRHHQQQQQRSTAKAVSYTHLTLPTICSV